jgi:uncharacterized membrane protein YeaQ/YmgE (transglycosylase-associated protein family)
MEFIVWIVVGAIAGWLAGMVMKSGGGLLTDIIVGIVGAFIGGFLFSVVGLSGTTGFNIWSIFVAFIGAVVLLAAIRLFNSRHRLTN